MGFNNADISTRSVAGSPMAEPVDLHDLSAMQQIVLIIRLRSLSKSSWWRPDGRVSVEKEIHASLIHVPLSILTADLQVLYFFFLCREASSSSSHSSGSSASSSLPDSSRIAHRLHLASRTTRQHGGRRPLEMALTRPRRCRSWCARSTRNTATPFFEALFTFVRGGGYKQQSSRALSVYAGQSLERVHLIHLINITLARL